MKNKACPVEIYVGVLKLIAGKYSVLKSGDDECTVFTEGLQEAVQGFVCERRKVVPFPGVGMHEPGVSTFDAEVVAEFVGGEGFDQGGDVDSFLFQRGEEGGEVKGGEHFFAEEERANRKRYVGSWRNTECLCASVGFHCAKLN